MSLVYRFKKEKLENGKYAVRPRILTKLHGNKMTIEIPALIDSGCDISVVPKSLAKVIGLDMKGKKSRLYAYRESTDVIESKATFSFLGKVDRENVKINNTPILIAVPEEETEDDIDITLGIAGIFDSFDITFKKSMNRIILKKVAKRVY